MVSLSQHLFALRLFTVELGEIVECCIGLGIELAASAILTDVGDFPRASPWSKTHRLRRVAVGSFGPPIDFLAFVTCYSAKVGTKARALAFASISRANDDRSSDRRAEGRHGNVLRRRLRRVQGRLGIRYRRRHQARRSLLAEAVGLGPGLGTAGSWDGSRISPVFSSPNACWNSLFFRAP
jgi:hypothetical protein